MDVSDIFNFFLLDGGEGGVRGDREGGLFFIENAKKGGVSKGGEGEGAWRVSAGNFGGGGGGCNIFFFGAEMSTKLLRPSSNFLELIRSRHYITVTLQ